jgi:DNA-binding NarL/FixJ family response regulator
MLDAGAQASTASTSSSSSTSCFNLLPTAAVNAPTPLATPPLRLLVVDDHAIVREGMVQLVQHHWPTAAVHEAASFAQAQATLAAAGPPFSLVLLDLQLGDASGLAPLRELRRQHPLLPVAVLSGDTDPARAQEALRLGAAGFLPKSSDTRVLLGALELMLSGGVYMPPFLLEPAATGTQPVLLTPRQQDVLACLVQGQANKEIARTLGLSLPTVKAHLVAIFRALRVKNRAQAVLAGQGLLGRAGAAGSR